MIDLKLQILDKIANMYITQTFLFKLSVALIFTQNIIQYSPILWPLIWRANSLEKTLVLGKIEDRRRRGQQSMRWLDDITNSMDTSLSKLWEIWRTGKPGVLQSRGLQRIRHDWVTEQQQKQNTLHFLDMNIESSFYCGKNT